MSRLVPIALDSTHCSATTVRYLRYRASPRPVALMTSDYSRLGWLVPITQPKQSSVCVYKDIIPL